MLVSFQVKAEAETHSPSVYKLCNLTEPVV